MFSIVIFKFWHLSLWTLQHNSKLTTVILTAVKQQTNLFTMRWSEPKIWSCVFLKRKTDICMTAKSTIWHLTDNTQKNITKKTVYPCGIVHVCLCLLLGLDWDRGIFGPGSPHDYLFGMWHTVGLSEDKCAQCCQQLKFSLLDKKSTYRIIWKQTQ